MVNYGRCSSPGFCPCIGEQISCGKMHSPLFIDDAASGASAELSRESNRERSGLAHINRIVDPDVCRPTRLNPHKHYRLG